MELKHARTIYAIKNGKVIEYFALGPTGFSPLPDDEVSEAEKSTLPQYDYRFGKQPKANQDEIDAYLRAIDDLAESMVDTLLVHPSTIPAGYTYLAQFVFHDVTWLSPTGGRLKNKASAALDLDSVLGNGVTIAEPGLAGSWDALRIGLTNNGGCPRDVPRKPHAPRRPADDLPTGCPLIPDTRNEGFLPLAQIHVAFMNFYNQVARLRGFGTPGFDQAAVEAEFIQHVQSVILYDLLFRLIDESVYNDVVTRKRRRVIHTDSVTDTNPLFIPIEFAAAAARFGHSMVRDSYDWNMQFTGSKSPVILTLIELSFQNSKHDDNGFQILENEWVVDWKRFFDLQPFMEHGACVPGYANPIGPRIAVGMSELPERIRVTPRRQGNSGGPTFNIARETLRRQLDFQMASAQTIVNEINSMAEMKGGWEIKELSEDDFTRGDTPTHQVFRDHQVLLKNTPIWFYILKEAQIKGKDGRLGPFGSRIVLETIHAAIEAYASSIVKVPDWTPTLEFHDGQFKMPDLIAFTYPETATPASTTCGNL